MAFFRNVNFLLILFVFATSRLFAWGEQGHKMVAQIAKSCLDKNVIDSVQFYLGKMSFKSASVWMDEIKKDKTYVYMNHWHYINIEKDASYVKTSEENIVNQLEKAISTLRSKEPRDKKKIALQLRILFHLMGDLHQPLHAGYGEDRGGNDIDVDFLGEPSNLHKVWDIDIIEKGKVGLKSCYEFANGLSQKEKQAFCKVDVVAWMNESRALLPEVYKFEKRIIDRQYLDKNKTVVQKQIVKAGIRLAAILNETFRK